VRLGSGNWAQPDGGEPSTLDVSNREVSMSTISMTAAELRRLRDELAELEGAGRAQIAARIKTAREWGDLKENGEYHAAKEAQAHLETRILRLREQLRSAVLVVEGGADRVRHGSTIEVTDLGTDGKHTFKIVAPNDSNPADGLISSASPIAEALRGKPVGGVAEVNTPRGTRRLRIDAIS
jgi:transcription elongation factor GreA